MGNGIVQELKREFDLDDEWMSYELHPETPAAGVPLAQRFPAEAIEGMNEQLNSMGAPYHVQFGKMTLLSNSNLALQASEYARDYGKFHEYHEKLLYAYFTEGKDLGKLDILIELAQSVGLNTLELKTALQENRYQVHLDEAKEQGRKDHITATPTFIINGQYKIVGAQSLQKFRRILSELEGEPSSTPFKML